MINPTFIHTITLFHQVKDINNPRSAPIWEKTVYEGCYFGAETVKQVNGTQVSQANNFICRIPVGNDNEVNISPGDIVAKGKVLDVIEDVAGKRTSDFLNKHQGITFTVRTVSYNTVLDFAKHIRVSGV